MSQVVKEGETQTVKPPKKKRKVLDILDSRFEEVLIVFGFIGFILLINLQVINRYLLPFVEIANITTWTEELSRYLFIFVSFFGASLAIRKGEVIRVNIFFDKLSKTWQDGIEIANTVFMLYF